MALATRGCTAREAQRIDTGRARLVLGFYGALLVVAFFWHAVAQDSNDLWRRDASLGAAHLLTTPLLGAALGLAVVALFRRLEPHAPWLPRLHREFRALLGRPSARELWLLAAASALAEEALFRGAMLDAWGAVASTLAFAAVHLPPRRSLWPWTASALLLGSVLAAVTVWTGDLGAAVAAHFVINLRNLGYITRTEPTVTP